MENNKKIEQLVEQLAGMNYTDFDNLIIALIVHDQGVSIEDAKSIYWRWHDGFDSGILSDEIRADAEKTRDEESVKCLYCDRHLFEGEDVYRTHGGDYHCDECHDKHYTKEQWEALYVEAGGDDNEEVYYTTMW